MFKKIDPKMDLPKMEEEILEYWEKEKIFEKSILNREGAKRYSFYDGPPFATGTPHYGHIVASVMKDAVPRYWTMRGFQVERKWGWDCHGLPIENIAEKSLGISRKRDIETLGVEKFNEFCRSTVLQYVDEWKKVIRRVGRWADMEHAYKTMDRDFMESVWWVFKKLWDQGLIYEGYRSMHICPRCETTLSQSEIAEGYKDVKDVSVVAKFELVDEPGTFVLAWTTTPWTLPGNVALAINPDTMYVRLKIHEVFKNDLLINIKESETYILEANRVMFLFGSNILGSIQECADYFKEKNATIGGDGEKIKMRIGYEIIHSTELIGKPYQPLFDCYFKDEKLLNRENGWKIYATEFVNTEEGTGVVHIAPAFGEDDMDLGKKENLPFVQHVNMDGTIKDEVRELAGFSVKPLENPQATDVEIIKYLAKKDLLFSKEKFEHSYPHCWRCDTPLLNYATSSWFVKVSVIKDDAFEFAKGIEWVPTHIKEGRFGKWLEGARDWSISRQRYWASVMPIWRCECGEVKVFGSVKELEDASGEKINDLHKHVVDIITMPCEKCEGTMHRVPDVLDTWFDSGSMPYAQMHYPFENTEKFESGFPAQFIAEGVDQTRCWFYYLHIIATAIKEKSAYQHVIVNGIVLAEDGKKMSKKLKNYPDPMLMFDKYGADVVRLYLLSSPVVAAENLNFSEKELSELQRNVFRMLWNSYLFFITYANVDQWSPGSQRSVSGGQQSLLDRWILSELQLLVKEVNGAMEAYELNRAARAFASFIDHLSNWYIRRSRKRFWKNENDADKEQAYQTLHNVLVTLAKLMAPFTPFIAEEMYRGLTDEESVHLADYPVVNEGLIDEKLNEEMLELRVAVSLILQIRADQQRKVRQPLSKIVSERKFNKEFEEILKEELNVKEVVYADSIGKEYAGLPSGVALHQKSIAIDITITPELKLEGEAREIIRAIQEGRKKAGFNVEDRIVLGYSGKEKVFEMFGDMIGKEVLAVEMKNSRTDRSEYSEETDIEGEKFGFQLQRKK